MIKSSSSNGIGIRIITKIFMKVKKNQSHSSVSSNIFSGSINKYIISATAITYLSGYPPEIITDEPIEIAI